MLNSSFTRYVRTRSRDLDNITMHCGFCYAIAAAVVHSYELHGCLVKMQCHECHARTPPQQPTYYPMTNSLIFNLSQEFNSGSNDRLDALLGFDSLAN
jgi:hypothetical protein